MKQKLLDQCIEAEEARLYDYISASNVVVTEKLHTMAVDKRNNLFINRGFAEENWKFIIGLLLHEAMHVHFEHVNESYEYPVIANIAQDIVINELINRIGYDLPENAATYASTDVPTSLRTSAEIYEYLVKHADKIPAAVLEFAKDSHPTDEQTATDSTDSVKKAAGKLASDILCRIEMEAAEKYALPKRRSLIESISRTLGRFLQPEFTRTFARPARYAAKGMLRPATRGHVTKPSIALYLDISGSMEGSSIEKAMGVYKDLDTHLRVFNRQYFTFNTETNHVRNFDSIKVSGGTEFESFHEADTADVVMIITDCELSFEFLEQHTRKKVIVISIGRTEDIRNCEVYSL